ncbi:unnamed protein product [Adineta ricciae]|nr:unnamed protein product [Adineta ricciae]
MTKHDEKALSPKKTSLETVDQSSLTDEASFGSCEPGTNVVLQGIVWNETDKGVLVVNITWRGKTYVGALLNTTEQNWAPPRYKSDVRSTKQNHNRDQQLTSIPSTHDSSERILRNGKRRGSSTTVTPSSTSKNQSFKIPPTPPLLTKTDDGTPNVLPSSVNANDEDDANSLNEEKQTITNSNRGGHDEEIGDNDSNRSLSPMTSGASTTSSSPPLSTTTENQLSSDTTTTIPADLSTKTTTLNFEQKANHNLLPYHFPSEIVDPSSYFSSRHGSTNAFNLPTFNKLSSQSSTIPSPFLSMPAQLYFNSLTLPHYPSVPSLSKTSH